METLAIILFVVTVGIVGGYIMAEGEPLTNLKGGKYLVLWKSDDGEYFMLTGENRKKKIFWNPKKDFQAEKIKKLEPKASFIIESKNLHLLSEQPVA